MNTSITLLVTQNSPFEAKALCFMKDLIKAESSFNSEYKKDERSKSSIKSSNDVFDGLLMDVGVSCEWPHCFSHDGSSWLFK